MTGVVNEVPKRLEYLKNTHGIKETKDVLEFLARVGQAVNISLKDDGAITLSDTFNFTNTLMALPAAITGVANVPTELSDDLTVAELEELMAVITSSGVVGERGLEATKEALKIAESIKMFIFDYFIRD